MATPDIWNARAQEAAKTIRILVNDMTIDEKAICELLATDHRTIQQGFTRLCVTWLERLAEQKDYDLRNEKSVELAKRFVERFKITERYLPII